MTEADTRSGASRGLDDASVAMASGRRLRIAVGLYGDVTYDSRVQREARSLADAGHDVTIYCLSGSLDRAGDRPPQLGLEMHLPTASDVIPGTSNPFNSVADPSRLGRAKLRAGWFLGYVRNLRAWGRWAAAAAGPVDVWHLHDLTALMAVAPIVGNSARLVYDSHEIFLEMGSARHLPSPIRGALGRYEGRLARRAEAMVTVNEALADYLGSRLRPRKTVIVRNCPPRWTPSDVGRSLLRESVGLAPDVPVVLYHGRFSGKRGIEQTIEATASSKLTGVHFILLGYGDLKPELERLADEIGVGDRVHFIPAVPPGELQTWVSGADVGVATYIDTSLNQRFASPNKLWECISVGTPIVTSDLPMMRKAVLEDPGGLLGAVCDPADASSIAAAIASLLLPVPAGQSSYRERCLDAAHERLNWETEVAGLLGIYTAISADLRTVA